MNKKSSIIKQPIFDVTFDVSSFILKMSTLKRIYKTKHKYNTKRCTKLIGEIIKYPDRYTAYAYNEKISCNLQLMISVCPCVEWCGV